MKLRTRILASYVAISLIPLLALTFWSWFQIARFVTAQLELSAADSMQRVSRTLAAELKMIDNVSIAVFADSRTREILGRPQGDYPMREQLADMAYLLGFLRSSREPGPDSAAEALRPGGRGTRTRRSTSSAPSRL
jgi:hypothetical protein